MSETTGTNWSCSKEITAETTRQKSTMKKEIENMEGSHP
jgi:hypothetical protein